MEFPRLKYLDAGPMAPQLSAGPAIAKAQAAAQIGHAIESVGQQGLEIMEKVRKMDEAGKAAAFFANLDEEASKFSIGLMKRTDPESWPDEWQEREAQFRSQMGELKMSPEGKARMAIEFEQWSSDRSIRFETQAATRAVAEGKARIAGTLKYQAEREDWEGMDKTKGRMAEAGFMPSEVEEVEREATRIAERAGIRRQVRENPEEWLPKLEDPDFVANTPGITTADAENLANEARELKRRNAFDNIEAATNAMLDGTLSRPEQLDTDPRWTKVDPATGERVSKLSPKVKAEIIADMTRMTTAAEKARRNTPEYMAEVTGYVSEQLDNYNVELEGFDERFYAMDRAIRTLPEGPEKARLNDRLQKVRQGQIEEYTAAGDDVRWQLKEAKRTGVFGENFSRQPIEDIIKDGILRSREKLQAVGFNAEQVQKIIDADEDERVNVFREQWKTRGGFDQSDPYTREAFKVIASGKAGEVLYYDKAKALESEREYGAAVSAFEKWHRQNPKADEPKRMEKFREILGEKRAKAFDDFLMPQLDGSVLPPIGENPDAPDYFIPPTQ